MTGRAAMAACAALLFCVQPGYVEAVVWVGAITDLLPATWFLLTLMLHWRFLALRSQPRLAATFVPFALCLGTHETAATILPMMLALDALGDWPGRDGWGRWARARAWTYLPFVVALAVFLAVAYVVNSRSYLVQEGRYALGGHVLTNLLDSLANLYVRRKRLPWHAAVVVVVAGLAWRGSPRVRFYLAWIAMSLLPASLFTWGVASRYLYVPAAGVALLLADLLTTAWDRAEGRLPRRVLAAAAAAVVMVLVGRFAMFAETGVDHFVRRTEPYARFAQAVRAAERLTPGAATLPVMARDVEGIPEAYRDAAAETALCRSGVGVVVVPSPP